MVGTIEPETVKSEGAYSSCSGPYIYDENQKHHSNDSNKSDCSSASCSSSIDSSGSSCGSGCGSS